MREGHKLTEIRNKPGADSAIVFIHGFKGDVDDTWGLFPTLLGTEVALADWNILSLGYNTSLLPGTRGIWSADPDLPILGLQLQTRLGIAPLVRHTRIALIAHSMGGLVAQRALVDDPKLADRIKYLFLFGTPSAGLTKAGILARLLGPLFGKQVHNMASGGEFISTLRATWTRSFGTPPEADPPFQLFVVAGDRDQFVPPAASLEPFPRRFQRVVTGDHLAMVKPADGKSESVQLVIAALTAASGTAQPTPSLRLAAEQGVSEVASRVVAAKGTTLTEAEIVEAALAFDRAGERSRSIELLQRHIGLGTDVQGTLAGRVKRRWLQEGDPEDATWALALYGAALATATANEDHEQVYYHAINVAFLKFVAHGDLAQARDYAGIALAHTAQSPREYWCVTTNAEAYLYLGNQPRALELYREAMSMNVAQWKLLSAGFQAQHVAAKLGATALQDALKALFDAEPPRRNRIFVSYSHRDQAALDELRLILKPLLKDGELEVWDDTRIKPGGKWDDEIKQALTTCRVTVLLVSAEFLASDYVARYELPVLLDAADSGDVVVLWVLLSPALYEETRLKNYQAAHNVAIPLAMLAEPARRQAWKDIAVKVKAAVFS
jgi:pimeloyl-ACP methyl ester carboxylesterase